MPQEPNTITALCTNLTVVTPQGEQRYYYYDNNNMNNSSSRGTGTEGIAIVIVVSYH
jgi:hypothetical protein